MIRLFIAFYEWLKLNFNVLSRNCISPCYQLILNETEVRKIYRLEERKVAGPSGPRISTGSAGRSLFYLTGPTVNILATGQRLRQTLLYHNRCTGGFLYIPTHPLYHNRGTRGFLYIPTHPLYHNRGTRGFLYITTHPLYHNRDTRAFLYIPTHPLYHNRGTGGFLYITTHPLYYNRGTGGFLYIPIPTHPLYHNRCTRGFCFHRVMYILSKCDIIFYKIITIYH